MYRRKRCPFCAELFWPNPRTKSRQKCCSKAECQEKRRQDTLVRWRQTHPEDGMARRYRATVAAAKAGATAPIPRAPPRWIERFPWEEARDEISPQLLVTLGFFGRFVGGVLRDEILTQRAGLMEEFANFATDGARDEKASHPWAP